MAPKLHQMQSSFSLFLYNKLFCFFASMLQTPTDMHTTWWGVLWSLHIVVIAYMFEIEFLAAPAYLYENLYEYNLKEPVFNLQQPGYNLQWPVNATLGFE